jgi:uncharacterized protein YbaR (Trm112 family)
MAIDNQLKEILVCPKCKGQVEIYEEKQEIHCRQCLLVYRIEEDIPIMLIDEAQPLRVP